MVEPLTFVAPKFALFLLVAALVYYRLPGRGQRAWLLLMSYAFVCTWSPTFAVVLLAATCANYWLGHRVVPGPRSRTWLRVGVGLNIALLVYFKYVAFFIPSVVDALGRWGYQGPTGSLRLIMPLGLSYYALQAISYLLDVHRQQMRPVVDLLDFGVYMSYFPKVTAGPLERARTFIPRLSEPRVVDDSVIASAFGLIVVGLVRKLVIADPLAMLIPEHAFYTPEVFTAPEMWAFLIAYGFYLYNDFAGYTSMARGVSRLFGIELSSNFNSPYFSRTFAEFWTRWHISLSQWLKDYVYMPLTRAMLRRRRGPRDRLNAVVPPVATMLVSALWHATAAHKTMLLWGVLHGGYLAWERVRPARPMQPGMRRGTEVFGGLLVFLLVMVAWVPFREGSQLRTTLATWSVLIDWHRVAVPDLRIALVVVPALGLDWLQHRSGDESWFLAWPLAARAASLALAIMLLLFALQAEPGPPFVYQGF